MKLGLSLGDATPSNVTTTTATTKTTVEVNKSLGFCMTLGMNPLIGTSYQHMLKSHTQVDQDEDDDDDGESDDNDDDDDDDDDDDNNNNNDDVDDDDGKEHQENDEQINLKEKEEGVKDVVVSSQRIYSTNPPVQLDLLPSAPVPRQTSFPWFPDNNGSSEGGLSVGGFDVRRIAGTVGMEEATSSFRLEFMSNGRIGSENHKRGFEMGNDTVLVERASSRASDEDEHGMCRKKLRLSKQQSAYLEESFKEQNTLNPKQKLALAEQLNLRPRQVEVWFQNRRARTKLKQTEVDFEYLKRCCETLTDENRKLHKELQELRALKTTSNPFYIQPPATTLTMCPSCERVASTTSPPPPSTALTKPVTRTS